MLNCTPGNKDDGYNHPDDDDNDDDDDDNNDDNDKKDNGKYRNRQEQTPQTEKSQLTVTS